jgi:N-acetylmuramoyl-L-alanine amidase
MNIKKIIVNIGHSETDSGAISQDGKTQEHRFNETEFVPLIAKELRLKGFDVVVMEQIKSFGELPARINAMKPDVILSIHSNAYNNRASGTEVLYFNGSKRGKNLADILERKMVAVLRLPERGTKPLKAGDRGFALVKLTAAPCVILEPEFLDNPGDLARVRACLPQLAAGIAEGVVEWLKG